MSVFLRAPGVDILAPDAVDDAFARERRAWLLPQGAEGEGEVATVWCASSGGRILGSLALTHVDWVARRAQLVAACTPDAPRPLALVALGAFLRYVDDELALERIEARARADDTATLDALRALGFLEEGRLAHAWHDAGHHDVALLARIVRHGP